jgi:hypothetical protein
VAGRLTTTVKPLAACGASEDEAPHCSERDPKWRYFALGPEDAATSVALNIQRLTSLLNSQCCRLAARSPRNMPSHGWTGWILHEMILRTAMLDLEARGFHWIHGRRTRQPETSRHPRDRRRRVFPADGVRRGGYTRRSKAAPANGL